MNQRTGRPVRKHIFASDLTKDEVQELRLLVKTAPRKIPYEGFWGYKRFLIEELERFLWYYDNRPGLHNQMACEYEIIDRGNS